MDDTVKKMDFERKNEERSEMIIQMLGRSLAKMIVNRPNVGSEERQKEWMVCRKIQNHINKIW